MANLLEIAANFPKVLAGDQKQQLFQYISIYSATIRAKLKGVFWLLKIYISRLRNLR